MVSVEATAYMIAEGLAARWKARKAKRSRAAAKKAAAAGHDPNPNPTPSPAKKPARASGAQVAPAAALEMVPAAAPADAGAGADVDAAKPKGVPAIDVAADAPGGERNVTPRGAGGDVEAPALGSQARPPIARACAVGSNRSLQEKAPCWHVLHQTALRWEIRTYELWQCERFGCTTHGSARSQKPPFQLYPDQRSQRVGG